MTTATKPKASATTVTIPKAELKSALAAVGRAVGGKTARPILQNVRIGNGVISGTDLEVRVDRAIAEVCDPFLVPYKRLAAIVKEATGDKVTLKVSGTSVKIKCGGGEWMLPTEDVSEYPTWEPSDLDSVCRLPADQFARAAGATTYATDTESSRYALGAVLLEVHGGNPTWVATDGRRLSCVETETDQAVDDRKVLVPSRVIDLVLGLFTKKKKKEEADDNNDDIAKDGDINPDFAAVQVETNSRDVVFSVAGTTVTGRVIEGRFPPWRDVLGEPVGEPSVLNVQQLLAAVRSAAIVTSEQSKGIGLAWAGDKLTLSARSAEYGESTVRCPVTQAGTTSGTKLDPRFVVDFLRSIPPDEEPQVDVYATDPQSRVLFRCGPYTGVIMPLAADA